MSSIEEQINAVTTSLLPDAPFDRRFGPKANLDERMLFHKTPGISIAVVNNCEIAWARGFGVREWGNPEPIQEDTVFQAGSISKPIFALAVMRLVEEGRLDLDRDVNQYLRSWKVPATAGWQPRVTLRQLLTHSAGLTVHGFPGYLRSEPIPSVPQVLDGAPPANTGPVLVNIIPGTQHRYSGGGTTIGQQVLVDVLDTPFPQIMRELVLDPLDMTNSTYEQPLPPAWEHRAATAHPWQYQKVNGNWHVYPEMAAAGLWSTATDLAKAGLALQRIRRGETGLLKQATVEQMLTPQIGDSMGIGFFLFGKNAGRRFGHGGWDEGFTADVAFSFDGGYGAVVMINSNQGNSLLYEVGRAIGTVYDWPDFLDADPATVEVAPDILQTYCGAYQLREGYEGKVAATDDGLTLQVGQQAPLSMVAISETKFQVSGLNAQIEFTKDNDGAVTGFRLTQNDAPIEANKVERT